MSDRRSVKERVPPPTNPTSFSSSFPRENLFFFTWRILLRVCPLPPAPNSDDCARTYNAACASHLSLLLSPLSPPLTSLSSSHLSLLLPHPSRCAQPRRPSQRRATRTTSSRRTWLSQRWGDWRPNSFFGRPPLPSTKPSFLEFKAFHTRD